jgi:hypothetical protein
MGDRLHTKEALETVQMRVAHKKKCAGKRRCKLKVRQENYELSALNIRTLISSAAAPLGCRGIYTLISIK